MPELTKRERLVDSLPNSPLEQVKEIIQDQIETCSKSTLACIYTYQNAEAAGIWATWAAEWGNELLELPG